jgi:hypothetical protein
MGLEYFNFKFNYKLVHGLQVLWAGPTITRYADLGAPQERRAGRWSELASTPRLVHDAAWHFSFLTRTDDVASKLESMFTPREPEWRGFPDGARRDRRDAVGALIAARQGFHDHMYAGSVWATVPLSALDSAFLVDLLGDYGAFVLPEPFDTPEEIRRRVDLAMGRLYEEEIVKVLHHATSKDLARELLNRVRMRARRRVRGRPAP